MSSAANLTHSIKPLTVLHTSDWHLGRRLYGRMRYAEFEAFLVWLKKTISAQQVDVLIVAGDIFDTMTPSNRAQALYYEFLGNVSSLCCQHIVIVAGNHDSPTFLDAPSQVLKFLNVHVIGTACEDLSDEVLVLGDSDGDPHCIVAAVPYLRDRDVRSSSAGESADNKDANVVKGIQSHYDRVASLAKQQQTSLSKQHQRYIPIIATGHLFAAGSKTTDDDGVRDLYVGNLGKISADMFDNCFDYVALGHLHVPQRVGGREHIRYSGSPMPMGFGEAKQQKQVLLVQFGEVHNGSIVEKSTDVLADIIVKPVEKLAKKTLNNTSGLIDDLFGFEELESIDDKKDHTSQLLNDEELNKANATDSEVLYFNESNNMQVLSLPIPCFQKLAQISGDLTTIADTIRLLDQSEPIWLEIIYDGDDIVTELREEVAAMVAGLSCEVLKIKNIRTYNKVLNQQQSTETLQDLNEKDVFARCLSINEVPDSQKQSLLEAYEQILHNIYHDDSRVE
ncbi:exonuclease SbcCD subunit D C-terminal domain-containing protein [Psychrobacter sp. AH5]|uniref:exonuclease SbcCD subunit D C-terminal domain-containing protein n=1 Tax=Psychrobacter sp. AH5 TaxID=2937433 RepID=UPI0033410E51